MTHLLSQLKNQLRRLRLFVDSMNPHMQWMFLLRSFFVICFCLIVASFYLLYQIKSEQIFQIKKTTITTDSVNQTLLKSVTTSLQARQSAKDAVKASPEVGDPSLQGAN